MNYLHAFHAGNFADVHKHVVLLALLQHLQKKPKPFFVLDTHAGRGYYDLKTEEARRGGEWQAGIGRLFAKRDELAERAPEIANYLRAVKHAQSHASEELRRYPGSPILIASALRANDRATFVERRADEAKRLKAEFHGRRHIAVFAEDGYASMKAQLPPHENRGLVLIDPPFEATDEFDRVADALTFGLKRWSNGIFCVWYPIKAGSARQKFKQRLRHSGLKKLLALELSVRPEDSPLGLNGSGLLLANPPFQLDVRMHAALPQLHSAIATDGGIRVEWLAEE